MHLIIRANHKDTDFHGQIIHRGQIVVSRKMITEWSGLSEKQVRTAVNHLLSTGEITYTSTNKYSVITICKYEDYQMNPNEIGLLTAEKGPAKRNSKGQQDVTQGASRTDNQSDDYDALMKTNGQQDVTQRASNRAISQEERIIEERIDDNNAHAREEEDNLTPDRIREMWNDTVTLCPKVTRLSDSRRQKVYSRIKEMGGKEKAKEIIELCFSKINNSSFCTGHNDRHWKAEFDWFFHNGDNWLKVYEGKYDDKTSLFDNKETSPEKPLLTIEQLREREQRKDAEIMAKILADRP